ncbi:MAG: hypothetical protein OCC49_02725 [Fibrobacterales bacterium]
MNFRLCKYVSILSLMIISLSNCKITNAEDDGPLDGGDGNRVKVNEAYNEPVLPTVNRSYHFGAPQSGDYTIYLMSDLPSTAKSFMITVGGRMCFFSMSGGCDVKDVDKNEVVNFKASYNGSSGVKVVFMVKHNDDVGSGSAEEPIELEEDTEMNGNSGDESGYFSFVAEKGGDYEIELNNNYKGDIELSLQTNVSRGFRSTCDSFPCTVEDLEEDETYYLVVRADGYSDYSLKISED